jgi:hypothetical protein
MRGSALRWVLALAVVAACSSAAPAAACRTLPGAVRVPPPDHTELHWSLALVAGGAVGVASIALQIAAEDQMFPEGAAGIELAVGIAEIAAGAVIPFTTTASGNSCAPAGQPSALPLVASGMLVGLGGWLVAHAIWSFADRDRAAPFTTALPFNTALSIDPEGAMLEVSARF